MKQHDMHYNIIYDNSSLLKKDLQHLIKNKKIAYRIKSTIEGFSYDPAGFLGNIKKLQPKEHNLYRIRIGDYRVILSIDFGNCIIIIHRIALRKDVYT